MKRNEFEGGVEYEAVESTVIELWIAETREALGQFVTSLREINLPRSRAELMRWLLLGSIVLASCSSPVSSTEKTPVAVGTGTEIPQIEHGSATAMPGTVDHMFGLEQGIVASVEADCDTSIALCLMTAHSVGGNTVSFAPMLGVQNVMQGDLMNIVGYQPEGTAIIEENGEKSFVGTIPPSYLKDLYFGSLNPDIQAAIDELAQKAGAEGDQVGINITVNPDGGYTLVFAIDGVDPIVQSGVLSNLTLRSNDKGSELVYTGVSPDGGLLFGPTNGEPAVGYEVTVTNDGKIVVTQTGEVLTKTPEPALPTYGEIDPMVADKLKAEGINIPEELNNPEYGLKIATEFFQTHWCTAFGDLLIPISTVPENGIAYGPYGIKGIGMTEEACTAYAEQHIKYMWIHYREYGNPADREITLEQYVELLRAGRGGFEIPQYNPETGFFDKKAMVNPLAGFTKIISDKKFKELPLKVSDKDSYLFYVDEKGMMWSARNDLEFAIEGWLDPNVNDSKVKSLTNDLSLANSILASGDSRIGLSSTFCLSTGNSVGDCVQEGFKTDDKYSEELDWLVEAYKVWLAKYKAGDHDAQRPVWVVYR